QAVVARAAGDVLDVADAAGAGGRAGGRRERGVGEDLAADFAAGEGAVVDVEVGDAAQQRRLVEGRQRHVHRREREAVGRGRQRAGAGHGWGAEQVRDDRAVHAGGSPVDVEPQLRVRGGDAGDVQRDVVRVRRVVVGDRRRAGSGGDVRRHLLVAVQRGGQAGDVAAQIDFDGGGEGAVVQGVGAVAAVNGAGAEAHAVGQ